MSTTEQQAASVDKKDLARLTLSAPFLVICVLYVTLLILSNLIAGKM